MSFVTPTLINHLAVRSLVPDGLHGTGHWARVLANGRRLTRTTGANLDVVELFAVFHDSCRENDGGDPEHGLRAARLAAKMRGKWFELGNADMELLFHACADHTAGMTESDVTIQTCWDADRLDLGRVGIRPDPARLCTDPAKTTEMLKWAHFDRYENRRDWNMDC